MAIWIHGGCWKASLCMSRRSIAHSVSHLVSTVLRVCHWLLGLSTTGTARCAEGRKHSKYRQTAAQHHAELLPFSVETYGGMASDAIKLLSAMGSMGDEQLVCGHGMW